MTLFNWRAHELRVLGAMGVTRAGALHVPVLRGRRGEGGG